MVLGLLRAKNMQNATSGGFEIISNHGTVALPPKCLRAHDRSSPRTGLLKQALDAATKLFRLHVICITSKGLVAPGAVWRVRFGIAATAQLRKMQIVDPMISKDAAEILLVKMRITPRAWKSPHVRNQFSRMRTQQRDKVLQSSI